MPLPGPLIRTGFACSRISIATPRESRNPLGDDSGRLPMKKLVLILLVLAAVVVFLMRTSPVEKRTCARMAELCGATKDDTARCAAELAELRKRSGDDVANRLHACVHDAQSCAQSSGCLVGANLGAAGAAVGDFFKGLGGALKK